jgi:tetratricopeptide (TPR) repeat protein
MAILIEGCCVVVRVSTIAEKYPGGLDAYRRDCPNATCLSDDNLCRVGFMATEDADTFVAELAGKGLTPVRDGTAEDVAVVRQDQRRASPPCDWVELAEYKGHLIAWLAGTPHGDLVAPAGWSPEKRMRYLSVEEAKERLEYVRTEDYVDVYRDKETGQLLYSAKARSSPSAEDRARHDALFRQAGELIEGLIILHGVAHGALDDEGRRRLDEAIVLYEEVVRINPRNWAAMWQLGKVHQRLAQYERGLEWFARAHRVDPDQVDVAREASIAAMDAGRPEEGVEFCRRALQVKPDDAGLRANFALALLFSGRPGEAQVVAAEALEREPGDEITAHLVAIIDEVVAGKRPCPRHVRELE